MLTETIIYRGVTFTRYPESPQRHRRVYYWADRKARQRAGYTSLHRAIYEDTYGPIPDGAVVHHRDDNPLNNASDNLEAVTPKEHAARHADEFRAERQEHAAAIRPLAVAWHRSDDGRQWHRDTARVVWDARPVVEHVCIQCGDTYASRPVGRAARLCSRRCINAWHQAQRTYYETRACLACGASFSVKKSSRQRTCSRVCGWQVRRGVVP